jgi:hypothetical protein
MNVCITSRWDASTKAFVLLKIKNSEVESVALLIQHTKSMRRIILSSVVCLIVPHFLTCLINGTIFGNVKYKIMFSIFSTNFEIFLIIKKKF